MATAALIRETLMKAKKYSEAMLRSQQEPEEDEEVPDEPEFDSKMDALMPVIRGELCAHFHAHRADDIFTAVRIAREFDLRYTLVHCTEGHLIAEDLAEIGVNALVGPNLCDRSKPELRELAFENPGILHNAGVLVGITTDHSVVPIQYLPLCASLAVKAGMPWEAALEAITINPARILGVDDRVGSIRVGKDADLVLTDGDPLAMMTKVKQVWIDGKTIK
jgi:imidazolonepropionase-like amidohydrolase